MLCRDGHVTVRTERAELISERETSIRQCRAMNKQLIYNSREQSLSIAEHIADIDSGGLAGPGIGASTCLGDQVEHQHDDACRANQHTNHNACNSATVE